MQHFWILIYFNTYALKSQLLTIKIWLTEVWKRQSKNAYQSKANSRGGDWFTKNIIIEDKNRPAISFDFVGRMVQVLLRTNSKICLQQCFPVQTGGYSIISNASISKTKYQLCDRSFHRRIIGISQPIPGGITVVDRFNWTVMQTA